MNVWVYLCAIYLSIYIYLSRGFRVEGWGFVYVYICMYIYRVSIGFLWSVLGLGFWVPKALYI